MQDGPRDVPASCPLSKHSLKYLDLLDAPSILPLPALEIAVDDEQDRRILERLRIHFPTCPLCTNAVQQAHVQRAAQRAAFQDLLLANEQLVPSSLAAIVEAINQEPQPHFFRSRSTDELPFIEIGQFRSDPVPLPYLRSRSYRVLQALLSLAAVIALIFATSAFFNHMPRFRTTNQTAARPQPIFTAGWEAAVIGRDLHGEMSIENYNPFTGRHRPLVPLFSAANATIDGVSHDGQNILYHYARSGSTYYVTLAALSHTPYFYSLPEAEAGLALWMSDSRHVLIASRSQGLLEVDSETGVAQSVSHTLQISRLYFYRNGYLYFTDTSHPLTLWRVNVSTGHVELVVHTTNGRSYFLSPDGTTIFYVDTTGTSTRAAIYTINVATLTTGPHLLLSSTAIPVGFARDNTLELVQEVQQSFQIVKLRPTQPAIERVVLANIAPSAVALCDHIPTNSAPSASICDENIALAPYGSDLLVTALNKDGTRQLWSDNLTTGQKLLLQTVSNNDPTHLQLPGWDRLQVG